MKAFFLSFVLCMFLSFSAEAVTYTQEDSVRVVQLLQRGRTQSGDQNLILYYAHQFLGVPYVGHT